ncbi:Zinc finger protein 862, partial [Frankliniella fusca]
WLADNTKEGKAINKAAKCTVCEIALRAHLTDLGKHAKHEKHLANMEKYNTAKQKRLESLGVQVIHNEEKCTDLRLAMYIATHTSIRSVDHLTDLLKVIGKGTALERLRLHRTKCSKLIKNVIAPGLLASLVEDINNTGAYSLIIDESTDISVVKLMAIMVKFFSKTANEMTTEFLGVVEVYRATAEALFESLKEYLNKLQLPIQNIVGVGSDGASSFIGKHNSVFTRLKA